MNYFKWKSNKLKIIPIYYFLQALLFPFFLKKTLYLKNQINPTALLCLTNRLVTKQAMFLLAKTLPTVEWLGRVAPHTPL